MGFSAPTALGVPVAELRRRRRNVWDRAIAARCLVRFSGLTQREAGAQLGIGTVCSVSTQLRKLEGAMQSDRALRSLVGKLEVNLAESS